MQRFFTLGLKSRFIWLALIAVSLFAPICASGARAATPLETDKRAASVVGSPTSPMTTPLIPRRLLFGNPDKINVTISPDGRFLAYAAPVEREFAVWVGPINVHGRPPRMQAFSSEGSTQSGPAQSYIRPLDCGASSWPRARMEMRGSGPNRPGELSGSSHIPGCPDPVSRTVCPYPSSGLPTFLPALSVRPLLRREAPVPCRLAYSASAPRRCALFCWPAPPRRAYEAFAQASGRATNPAAHLAGQPSAPPTSHP